MPFVSRKACGGERSVGGFSLLEILIVVNVIALLVAIATPAVMAMRESANRAVCRSNLRQIGLALRSYESSHNVLPPAIVWSPGGVALTREGFVPPGTADLSSPSGIWQNDRFINGPLLSLVAYLEENPLHEQWNFDVPASAPHNATVRSTTVAVFVCPSDSGAHGSAHRCEWAGGGWARGNYAMNAGPDPPCLAEEFSSQLAPALANTRLSCRAVFPSLPSGLGVRFAPLNPLLVREVWGSGIGGVNHSISMSMVRDGASHTAAYEEIRAGLSPRDRRGAWAMPGVGSSVTFGHGKFSGGGGGPNPCWAMDFVQDCEEAFIPSQCMPCRNGIGVSVRAHARSRHPGGVHVLLLDGSVSFCQESMDLGVWTAMHTIDQGDDLGVARDPQ